MAQTQKRSTKLFKELIETLVNEGMDDGQFGIDSMRYTQMEMMGHLLGKDPSWSRLRHSRLAIATATPRVQPRPERRHCPHRASGLPLSLVRE